MDVESRVLAELSQDRYSSGEAISHKLDITRSAVWKHIVKLRENGYVIEAAPSHGYRLVSRPDKLLPAEVEPLLKTGVIGSRIIHLDKTGSTADLARGLIDESAPEGTVVVAEEQTKGRGRMGRSWQTPAGKAIAISVILYPPLAPARAPVLSLVTALAVKKALDAYLAEEAAPVALKWPNDIYFGDKKLGGILMEMAAELDRVRWVVDSIGLNVNNSFKNTELEGTATSLAAELGREVNRRELLAAVLNQLDRAYAESRTESGLAALLRVFEKHHLLQGKQVEVTTEAGVNRGIVLGIDDEGRLRLRGPDGKVLSLFSGEATLAGPRPK